MSRDTQVPLPLSPSLLIAMEPMITPPPVSRVGLFDKRDGSSSNSSSALDTCGYLSGDYGMTFTLVVSIKYRSPLTIFSPTSISSNLRNGLYLQYWTILSAFPPRLLRCRQLRPEFRRSHLHHRRIWHDPLYGRVLEWLYTRIHKPSLLVI